MLHARYLAWLDAPLRQPEPPRPNRRRHAPAAPPPPTSRRQKMQAAGTVPEAPDPGGAAYLLRILFDIGPVICSGMGESAVGYEHIMGWERAMGASLSPWERGLLRRLSLAYAEERCHAQDPLRGAPGSETPEQAEERRERVSRGLAEQLRALRDTRPDRPGH